jgi:hypothetical protein
MKPCSTSDVKIYHLGAGKRLPDVGPPQCRNSILLILYCRQAQVEFLHEIYLKFFLQFYNDFTSISKLLLSVEFLHEMYSKFYKSILNCYCRWTNFIVKLTFSTFFFLAVDSECSTLPISPWSSLRSEGRTTRRCSPCHHRVSPTYVETLSTFSHN